MKEFIIESYLFIIGAGIGILIGMPIGSLGGEEKIQKQAIENNCMYHEPKTGKLVWGSIK